MSQTRRAKKRWGRVTALPSEYLIKMRGGRIKAHGPGLSVFLWPGDSYTVLPTSIQRVSFTADQITSEKVGVAVTGVAVYRVGEPLLAFRLLDFSSNSQAAAACLAELLRDMFIGAARRLVANMTVEQCLTQRKEAIAQELMREIQPVVAGQGRAEDSTDQGWGLLIDTIEIQDVRILSKKVFADLQAPYRTRLELASRTSLVQRDEELHLREVSADQRLLAADQELRRRQGEAEEQRRLGELEVAARLRQAELESQGRLAQRELEEALAQQQRQGQLAETEHNLALEDLRAGARREQQAAQLQAELSLLQAETAAKLGRLETEASLALQEMESFSTARLLQRKLERRRLRGELDLALGRQKKELENLLPEQRLRYELITKALPAIAEALGHSLGPVHLTQISSGKESAGGLGFLAEAVAQVMAVGRGAGLEHLWQGEQGADPETAPGEAGARAEL